METNYQSDDTEKNTNDKLNNPPFQTNFESGTDERIQKSDTDNEEGKGRKIKKWEKPVKQYIVKVFEPLTLATVILAWFTYQLFSDASHATDNARLAFNEQIINDSTIRVRDSTRFSNDTSYANKKFIADSISSGKGFKISTNVLQSQINSLKQSQKDFEIENRPFIIYSDIKIDTPFVDNEIQIEYNTKNVGKFPAKISTSYASVIWGMDTTKPLVENLWFKKNTKTFLANGDHFLETVTKNKFSDFDVKVFKEGIIHVYLFLKINYYSDVLSKEYASYNVIEITYYDGKLDYTTIENK